MACKSIRLLFVLPLLSLCGCMTTPDCPCWDESPDQILAHLNRGTPKEVGPWVRRHVRYLEAGWFLETRWNAKTRRWELAPMLYNDSVTYELKGRILDTELAYGDVIELFERYPPVFRGRAGSLTLLRYRAENGHELDLIFEDRKLAYAHDGEFFHVVPPKGVAGPDLGELNRRYSLFYDGSIPFRNQWLIHKGLVERQK
jgi:hypothetical protein